MITVASPVEKASGTKAASVATMFGNASRPSVCVILEPLNHTHDMIRGDLDLAMAESGKTDTIVAVDGATSDALAICQSLGADLPDMSAWTVPENPVRGRR